MKDFVSRHRASVVALLASMSIVSALFVPYGRPWAALAWASLALLPLVLRSVERGRSMTQLVYDVEAEPVRVVAVRAPGGKVPKAVL